MTADEERWAEALAIQKLHENDAPRFIAERIGGLALAGDKAGVDRWLEIAQRLDEIMQAMAVRH